MSVVVGVLLGAGLATVVGIGWAVVRAPRAARTPAALGMQSALHAATATLPHLRRGLSPVHERRGERTHSIMRPRAASSLQWSRIGRLFGDLSPACHELAGRSARAQ